MADFSNTAGSAAVLGNEVYGPYGKQRYHQGTHGTTKGFTGQYNDSLTGLDYYNARSYDPVVGVFLSADTVQGNGSGRNPYGYVGGNPETLSDPSGERFAPPPCGPAGCYSSVGSSVGSAGGGGAGSVLPAWSGNLQPFLTGKTGTSTNTGACNTAGCRFGVYGDAGSVWEKVGGSTPLSSGGSCTPSAMGGFSVLNCGLNYSTGQTEGVWVRRNLVAPLTMCTPPFNCDEGTGSSEEGGSKAEVFASDEGGTSGEAGGGGAAGDVPELNPNDIGFTQDTVNNQGNGYTVRGNIEALKAGTLSPEAMGEPIRVFTKTDEMNAWGPMTKYGYTGNPENLLNGQWYTLDNRRLLAFQEAGLESIPVQIVDDLSFIKSQRWKFSTTSGGMDLTLLE